MKIFENYQKYSYKQLYKEGVNRLLRKRLLNPHKTERYIPKTKKKPQVMVKLKKAKIKHKIRKVKTSRR